MKVDEDYFTIKISDHNPFKIIEGEKKSLREYLEKDQQLEGILNKNKKIESSVLWVFIIY